MPELYEGKKDWEYDVIREGEENILYIYVEHLSYAPSIEDYATVMSMLMDILAQVTGVTKIVFSQKREHEYDYSQTKILMEIVEIYKKIIQEKDMFSYSTIGLDQLNVQYINQRFAEFQNLAFKMMKSDPISAYVELLRALRREKIDLEKITEPKFKEVVKRYAAVLNYVVSLLEKTRLVELAKPYIPGYKSGDRSIYRYIFTPVIKPDFMFTKLMSTFPPDGEEIDSYTINDESDVTVFKFPDDTKVLYHLMPPEFKLSEDKYELLDIARKIMAEHKPREEEFTDPERMREVFFNIGHDLLEELAKSKNIMLRGKEIDKLTDVLVRYTVGFGLIEVLLQDEKIQDISINSPLGKLPMFIVHADHGDCYTNIVPTKNESEGWASKLRLISGRPLDEANPILDTELELPSASTRVAVITKPLNPTGLAYSFRRHRDKPWTLPLFIKAKMINPTAAGLLSFLIDGTRTMLIAGTRSSGKSSLLSGLIVEIMRKYRIITIEDTLELPCKQLRDIGFNIQSMKVASALGKESTEVDASTGIRTTLRLGDSALIIGEVRSSLRGNEEVVVVDNGVTKRMAIETLEKANLKSILIPTLDEKQKMKLKKLTGFVKHPKCKQLVKLTTKTGREITVTPDHSVFTHVNFKIAAINANQLMIGDPVIIPSKLPMGYNDINYINLLNVFKDDYRIEGAEQYIRKAVSKLGWRKASAICKVSDIYRYLLSTQKTRIPISSFIKLMKKARVKYNLEILRIKRGTSTSIPAKLPINENILRLIGYYLAEGNSDGKKIQITNSKPEIIEDITKICKKEFGIEIYKRKVYGKGSSIQMFITCKPLTDLFEHWGCGKTSLYKRIPKFVYGLNTRKICALLKGMYSGDGSVSVTNNAGNMIRYFSTSKKLIDDVAYGLLSLGIVCRIHHRILKSGKICYTVEIKQRKYIEYFLKNIGFTHKKPNVQMKAFAHSKDDSVVFEPKELEKHMKLPHNYRHLRRINCCSKDYLKRITEEVKCSNEIYDFAHGDFFIDRVKSIEVIKLKKPEYVYDLSVNSTQRFIGGFGGILLHNTEAIALYEAMRVGAAANVVAGTIHSDSPYGVYDRVVNDIGIPKTSFKATDVCIVANPIRSADGLHRFRRVTQITEVRKHWNNDPLEEKGFVDLMKYDADKDELVVTPDLQNGDSDVLKAIAGNIKEFAGDWDAIWDNIMLRANIKSTLVDVAAKAERPDLLEAPFVIKSNDIYHILAEKVKNEVGALDSKKILFEWNEWLKREVRKKV
ncbi:Flp pilus assembly complex ATPase component TadA [Candidatus Woesearchaeota archaeon]|nr:Flp pilus assembly complex ATPase component TadA [Candidatus Woesearchaeota archaeon]